MVLWHGRGVIFKYLHSAVFETTIFILPKTWWLYILFTKSQYLVTDHSSKASIWLLTILQKPVIWLSVFYFPKSIVSLSGIFQKASDFAHIVQFKTHTHTLTKQNEQKERKRESNYIHSIKKMFL